MNNLFEKCENVVIKSTGAIGTVNDIRKIGESYIYTITINGEKRKYAEESIEVYYDIQEEIIKNIEYKKNGRFVDLFMFFMYQKFEQPIEGKLYSYQSNRLIFNPYQYKPVLKFLASGSEERLFIADEVGVGKTIETGIILDELRAREIINDKSPILIVCPKSLCEKWKKEMNEKFNFDFYIQDGVGLSSTLNGILKNIPDRPRIIVGLQLLRDNKYREMLNKIKENQLESYWKMVVIDECHHLRNSSTDSNKLGILLSENTEKMLMLSATPLNLKNEDLFNQLHILNPIMFPNIETFNLLIEPIKHLNNCIKLIYNRNLSDYDEILNSIKKLEQSVIGKAISKHEEYQKFKIKILEKKEFMVEEIIECDKMLNSFNPLDMSFTRSLKRDVLEHKITREIHTIPIKYNSLERKFYDKIIEFAKNIFLNSGGNPLAVSFITNGLERMASSCIPALKNYLIQMIEKNEKIDEESLLEEELKINFDGVKENEEIKKYHYELSQCINEIEKNDTKYREFLNVIINIKESAKCENILVFSYYVKTLEYLYKKLTDDGYKVGMIHGKIPMKSEKNVKGRNEIIQEFKNADIEILLTSEVGAEGLDFQFCNALINYDLPYNPMRVEQRIGRIDRFGQKADKIMICNLFVKNSIDEVINDILVDRIQLAENMIGELEPIINNTFTNLKLDMLKGELTLKQLELRKKELEKSMQIKKKELDEYENNRLALLKDKEYEKKLFELDKMTFLSAIDSLNCTKEFLSFFEECELTEIDESNLTAKIKLSRDFIILLKNYQQKYGNNSSYRELVQIINLKNEGYVIFDGNKSYLYNEHILIKPYGAWSKFMISQLKLSNRLKRTFIIDVQANNDLVKGQYIILLYDVLFEGVNLNKKNFALAYDINNENFVEVNGFELNDNLLKHTLREGTHEEIDINKNQIENIIYKADKIVSEKIQVISEKIKNDNNIRIEGQINSIQNSLNIKIDKYENQIENHIIKGNIDKDFINMTSGKIYKEKENAKKMIDKLIIKKELDVSTSLIGVAITNVLGADNNE